MVDKETATASSQSPNNRGALYSLFGISKSDTSESFGSPNCRITKKPETPGGDGLDKDLDDVEDDCRQSQPINPNNSVTPTIQDLRKDLRRVSKLAEDAKCRSQSAEDTAKSAKATAASAKEESEKITDISQSLAEIDQSLARINFIVQSTQRMAQQAEEVAKQANENAQSAKDLVTDVRYQAEQAEKKADKALGRIHSHVSNPNHPNHRWFDVIKNSWLLWIPVALLALLILLFWLSKRFDWFSSSTPVPPTSLYVDPNVGNDGNNGTITAPFKTLSPALRKAGSESKVYVAQGEYNIERSLSIPGETTIVAHSFNDFNDIDGHWSAPFVRALATKGLVKGYPDGSFRPDSSLTRAEYAALLTNVFELPQSRSSQQFSDVANNFWAYDNIQRAYGNGYLKGFPEGDFQPNQPVQRAQVIASLVSGLGGGRADPLITLRGYSDRNQVPSWAKDAVAFAATQKLITSYPSPQRLRPTRPATRAEAAVMMYQALVNQGEMPAIDSPYIISP